MTTETVNPEHVEQMVSTIERMMRGPMIIGLLMCIIPLIVLIFSLSRSIYKTVFWARAWGKVIDFKQVLSGTTHNGSNHVSINVNYAPEIEFRVGGKNGELYTFVSAMAAPAGAMRIGQRVPLLYNRKNPEKAVFFSIFWLFIFTPTVTLLSMFLPLLVSFLSIRPNLTTIANLGVDVGPLLPYLWKVLFNG